VGSVPRRCGAGANTGATGGTGMSFPEYTETGRMWNKKWLEIQLEEIEKEAAANQEDYPDWLPMIKEVCEYVFKLEERVKTLEEKE